MASRLNGGDTVVLFAEGTSSDGNRILPFRSALVGSVHHTLADSAHHANVTVQPLSLAYVGIGGVYALRSGDPNLVNVPAGATMWTFGLFDK